MKSETIYEIMLSVLSEDATEDEHRLLNEWLACSEANRKQFEQVVGGSVAVKANGGEEFRIVPSEQFCYNKESRKSGIRVVDTDLYTSWVKGEYIFKDAALEEIFNKLLHWYDFTVRYQNEQLKDKRFSLVIDRKISLEQLLELISFTSDVKLERSQGNIIYVKQRREEV